jgi:hypothetical protein
MENLIFKFLKVFFHNIIKTKNQKLNEIKIKICFYNRYV